MNKGNQHKWGEGVVRETSLRPKEWEGRSQDLKQGGEVKKECFRDNMCEGLEEREKDTTVPRTNSTEHSVCEGEGWEN